MRHGFDSAGISVGNLYESPLISSVTGLVVNFVLNWILIYGRFGMPKMGAAGAAVGTLVSSEVNLVMLINIVIGHQAESAIAAMAAFRVLEGFVLAFFAGLADASAVVVGKEIGAGAHMRGYQYVKKFALLCPAITFVICFTGLIRNRPMFGLFGLGSEAMYYGKYMILIYLAAGTIRTCNYIMNNCYRAGGEAIFGTILEITCLFTISVPATWIAGMVLHLPFLAVFAFLYTDEILRLIFELLLPHHPQEQTAYPTSNSNHKTFSQ